MQSNKLYAHLLIYFLPYAIPFRSTFGQNTASCEIIRILSLQFLLGHRSSGVSWESSRLGRNLLHRRKSEREGP